MEDNRAKKYQLFLPPYLQHLGYGNIPCVVELSERAVVETPTHIDENPTWSPWRGIFEYIACVEYAREVLISLPEGRAIGGQHVVPARYNSAALVFFAQASLDNIAVWMSKLFKLKTKGSNLAFHVRAFKEELQTIDPSIVHVITNHRKFINALKDYRKEWIHRLTGGANMFSDKIPSDPTCHTEIAVPIDPKINMFDGDRKLYVKMVAKCKTDNNGRWLYTIKEFANIMANGTKEFSIDMLSQLLVKVK
jgi:hypothetical protein